MNIQIKNNGSQSANSLSQNIFFYVEQQMFSNQLYQPIRTEKYKQKNYPPILNFFVRGLKMYTIALRPNCLFSHYRPGCSRNMSNESPIYLSLFLAIHLLIHISIYQSIFLSIHLSMSKTLSACIYLYIHLSIYFLTFMHSSIYL